MARVRRSDPVRKIVLLYHSIGSGPWAVPEYAFISQMEWLHQVARLVSLEQLVGQKLQDSLQVAITFDDGYASLRDQALPILKRVGAVATVFLNTGQIAAGAIRNISNSALGYYPDERFLSQQDVVQLAAEGWSIGSHGVGHIDLTRARRRRSPPGTRRFKAGDRETSVDRMRHCLPIRGEGTIVGCGTWSQKRDTGMRSRGSMGPCATNENPMAIPRINVAREYTMSDFKAIVRGDWDYLGWIQKMKAGL